MHQYPEANSLYVKTYLAINLILRKQTFLMFNQVYLCMNEYECVH